MEVQRIDDGKIDKFLFDYELLFDKNNKTAYKALQELQKGSEETDHVYPYMGRLSGMLESDKQRQIGFLCFGNSNINGHQSGMAGAF